MKRILTLASLSLLMLTSIGCKKEGCTDIAAINYENSANKDNGSCIFEGEAVLWYDQSSSQSFLFSGISSLKFYVDETLVGSTDASVYWTNAPECGENGSITVTKELGNSKSKTFTYKVENNFGTIVESGILNISANSCEAIKIY